MPRLVLPVSGCLSRRTLTRATRGEARGAQVSLSAEPIVHAPPLFLYLGLSSAGCVLVIWWTGPMWLRCCGCIPAWFRPVALLCGHVGPRRTHSTLALAVCCLCIASRCGCTPASGLLTPSRCRALVHSRCQWCRDRLGHNGPARLCVCGNRGRRAHHGYPSGSGRLGVIVRIGRTLWCICVVAVFGLCDRRVGTAWRHTPVIHDDPDRRSNRCAFTLTGPSPILRCWFGKGTP